MKTINNTFSQQDPSKEAGRWYVYLLQCRDQKIYVGCTGDLKQRMEAHRKGIVHFTKTRLPITLVSYTFFDDKYKAFNYERYLKSGSGRAFMKRHLL
ncbi:MAG: GIY-YIG nuclease family protein [Bacteroidales bacterium]|nr:GIY-YIG nuclease family protein [Bacteroidales bacterium]